MVPFGGWEMPLSYPAGTLAEHQACRSGAVAFDVSHLGTVRLRGADAFDRLQRALTNDLGRIGPGRAQYTHLLDEADGSVVDDIIVWWVADGDFHVMPNASNTDSVVAALGGHDVTAGRAVVAVQGPEARRYLAGVAPEAAEVPRFAVRPFSWKGSDCVAAGTAHSTPSSPAWAPVTPCAWRPACPCTATSWGRASPRCRPAWAGWWAGRRATSAAGRPWRRSGSGA